MSNKIEFNGEEVEIPSFGVYLFEQAKKEAYNQALDDFIEKAEAEKEEICFSDDDDFMYALSRGYQYSIDIAKELKGE